MSNIKIKLVFAFLVVFMLGLASRLFYLQIIKGGYFEVLALGQHISFEEKEGERGEIFFNDGKTILAQTQKKNIVFIFPNQIPSENFEKTAVFFSEAFNEKKEDMVSLLNKGETVKKEVSRLVFEKIKKENPKGAQLEESWGRFYPQKRMASNVVGFLNEEGQGQYGIEGFYNGFLEGENELSKIGKFPLSYLAVEKIFSTGSSRGSDIFLTLDYNIQYFSEKILKKAWDKWNIDSGQIIVSDPLTGKILALAAFPGFDPNKYAEENSLAVFMNPSVQMLFEPGSIFKPITYGSAIEENLINPDMTYEDKGFVNLGGPSIYNFGKRVWGEQTLRNALEESINTGAVFVEQKLGENLFLKYVEKFGFFEKTGIDLQGEVFSINENLHLGRPRDVATASFGQGIEVTPFQIIRAFSAIANGGTLLQPFIVEKITEKNGEEKIFEPKTQRKVISKNTCDILSLMMVSVVETGSASQAKIDGYLIAGKTGTAQVPLKDGGYSEDKTIHSFIGFFPALNPKYLVFFRFDNPKGVSSSGQSAAALSKELIKYIIDLKQIAPGTWIN